MEYFQIKFVVSAIVVLLGGYCILTSKHENRPLKLLSFFLVAYMLEYVEQAVLVWAVEMLLIFFLIRFNKIVLTDCRWYWWFILFVCISLSYSQNPIRGIPGLFMYVMPLFYYSLASVAVKSVSDVSKLFRYISNTTFFLLILGLPFYSHRMAYPYYGMAICSIPAFLYITTKQKKYILPFIICILPALFWVKRTPLLGIAVGMMVFSFLLYRWKAVLPTIIALFVGITLIVSVPQFNEKMTSGDSQTSEREDPDDLDDVVNTNGRTAFWMLMIDKYYKPHPILGVGHGTVKAFLQSDQNEFKKEFPLMHNDWLLVLCEIGIVGTSLLLMFFINIIRKCIKYSSKTYSKELRFMSAVCAASVTSTMTHMFFENCMNSFVLSTCFVFCAIFNFYIRSYQSGEIQAQEPVPCEE